ncbi:MAG: hypothetical protein FWF84_04120 [Kiritimatiellaeota bacterium]|nr:hypothetical protein [Kiritimatiellota bacterium]
MKLKRIPWMGVVLPVLCVGIVIHAGRWLRHSPEQGRGANTEATAITVMLGGFRGVIADVLWCRLAALQEQGQYIELMQLAEWIAMLEPDNGEVWDYQAWNLAYNVSAMMSRPADRWRWVLSGIELLRDRGTVMAPTDPKVKQKLGWMFQDKMGGTMDTAADHYREQWAAMMTEAGIMPPGPNGESGLARLLEDATLRHAFEQRFTMRVDTMQKLEDYFGALDWRLPWAHAMYWGDGAATVAEAARASETMLMACKRLVYQSIMLQFRWCEQFGDAAAQAGMARLVEGGVRYLDEMSLAHDFSGITMAHAGMLFDGARLAHRLGAPAAARRHYDEGIALLTRVGGVSLPSFEDVMR